MYTIPEEIDEPPPSRSGPSPHSGVFLLPHQTPLFWGGNFLLFIRFFAVVLHRAVERWICVHARGYRVAVAFEERGHLLTVSFCHDPTKAFALVPVPKLLSPTRVKSTGAHRSTVTF